MPDLVRQSALILAIDNPAMTRDRVAFLYSRALSNPTIDWKTVNAAIVDRWSQSALIYIKRLAWRYDTAFRRALHAGASA